jgi:phosphoribosylanthranilate isomerase
MIVKICGITTPEDAVMSIEYGADMLGFNFYPKSPRYISVEKCKKITSTIKNHHPNCLLTGIFVDKPVEIIQWIMKECCLDLAQLCGSEPATDLDRLDGKGFKAFRPQNDDEVKTLLHTVPARLTAPEFLLDAYLADSYGGSGRVANWELAAKLSAFHKFLLAGGLTPANVAQAINTVRPWGVDVASGVESAPGKKDPGKVKAFIEEARHCT